MGGWLGLDVGGANLKAALRGRWAESRPFPLWREPQRLAAALTELLQQAPAFDGLAATMTGELADCFRTRREGVAAIATATEHALRAAAAQRGAGDVPLRFYLTDGTFVSSSVAIARAPEAGASNWHALARMAARLAIPQVTSGSQAPADAASPGLLIVDLGSTTCDIIPMQGEQVAATGRTDTERMLASELVYTGVERSPICATTSALPYRGQSCPVMQELFATTRDAYLLLGDLPEQRDACDTADGRPATREFALERLARMIGADRETFEESDALAAAQAVEKAQLSRIGAAVQMVLRRLAAPPQALAISGAGEFLLRRMAQRLRPPLPVISLAECLAAELQRPSGGPAAHVDATEPGLAERLSSCAAALAVAVLAEIDPSLTAGSSGGAGA